MTLFYRTEPPGEFARKILGMDMSAARNAFAEYLAGVLQDLSVLQGPPFTDRGRGAEAFTHLSLRTKVRHAIDSINANAAA